MKKMLLMCLCLMLSVLLYSGRVMADLNMGLVAFYSFNGDARDEINEYHGTIMPSVSEGAILTENRFGDYNSCYKFDGSNDWIDIELLEDAFGDNFKTFSFTAWFKTTYTPTNVYGNVLFSANKSATGSSENVFRIGTGKKGGIFLSYNSNTHYEYGKGFNDGNWHFLAVSFDSTGKVSCSVDSQLITDFPNGVVNLSVATKLSIAQDWDGSTKSDFWNGYLDDIKIYSRALSDSEIEQLKNENTCDTQYNQGYNDGQQSCINDPSSCGIEGLYTEEDMLNMVNKLLEWDINKDKKIDLVEVLQILRDLTGVKKDSN